MINEQSSRQARQLDLVRIAETREFAAEQTNDALLYLAEWLICWDSDKERQTFAIITAELSHRCQVPPAVIIADSGGIIAGLRNALCRN